MQFNWSVISVKWSSRFHQIIRGFIRNSCSSGIKSNRSMQKDKSCYQSKNSLHYRGWSFTRVKTAGGWEKESRRKKHSNEGTERIQKQKKREELKQQLKKEKKVKKTKEDVKKLKQTVFQRKDEDNTIENLLEGLEISTSADDAVCPVCGTMYWEDVICNSCNMAMGDLPDMYARSPRAAGPAARGLKAYNIRQIMNGYVTSIMYHFVPIVTAPVVLIPQVIVTLVCKVISTNC